MTVEIVFFQSVSHQNDNLEGQVLIIILTTLDHLYLKTRLEKVRLKCRAQDSRLNSKELMALLGGQEVSFLSF